jgi:hypothetical protein
MVDHVDFDLKPWGTLDFETDGTGALKTGVVEVYTVSGSDSDLEGTEIFTIFGGFVSVGNSEPQRSQQVYVTVNSEEKAGIAVYNPDEDDPVTLELVLLDSEGSVVATIQLVIQPREHLAKFVDEAPLFPNFDFFQADPEGFEGTLNIRVLQGEDVSIVGLIQKLDSGALIAVSPSSKAFNAPAP